MFRHSRIMGEFGRFLLVTASILQIAPRGQSAEPEFRFTAVDDKLLEQANDLDEKIAKNGLIFRDSAAEAYLAGIGTRLLAGTPPLEHVNFCFHIIRDPMVNAFALPNGSVYVNSGLIAAVRNEAELASIISHEITHVTGRHAYIENRSIRKKNVALDVVLAGAAAAGIRGGVAFGQSIWLAAQASQIFMVASVYGYNRELESEADRGGYSLLIQASYDGKAMTDALEILDEKIEPEPSQPFWRTHPKIEERIIRSKSMTLKENSQHPREVAESDYLEHLAPVVRLNIEFDLDSRRARTAVDRAQRLVDWAPADARNIVLLAEAYSALGAKAAKPSAEELTRSGEKENRKRLLKRTAEEEQQELMVLPSGRRTLAENRSKAESFYRRAIQASPELAVAHRGLGMLYEDESKNAAAAAEYTEYLGLVPANAMDRLRIERRLEKVRPRTGNE